MIGEHVQLLHDGKEDEYVAAQIANGMTENRARGLVKAFHTRQAKAAAIDAAKAIEPNDVGNMPAEIADDVKAASAASKAGRKSRLAQADA